jgi:membrane fusion protein, multidrug efflux system
MIDRDPTRGVDMSGQPRALTIDRSPVVAWAGSLLTAALLAGVLAACGEEARAGSEEQDRYERVMNVEVLPVETRRFRELVRVTGTVQANYDVTVSAEESGVVREMLVERGNRVREGEPLLRVDDRVLRSQVREAEARAALATETWERRRRRFGADGVGAADAYHEARNPAQPAQAAQATLRERMDRAVVRAPVSGVLDDRLVEVGTMVSAGTEVARIVQLDPVKVTGGVPERFAGEVTRGSRARVTFDVLGGEGTETEIRYVGSTVNPRNRTFQVELVVPNPGRTIKPEMVANIEIVRRILDDAVVIPQDALVRVEDGFVAFVVEEDERGRAVARSRSLVLGPAQRNLVVVREGLEAGDRLVVVGQSQVANRDRVRVVEEHRPVRDTAQSEGGER